MPDDPKPPPPPPPPPTPPPQQQPPQPTSQPVPQPHRKDPAREVYRKSAEKAGVTWSVPVVRMLLLTKLQPGHS